MTLNYTLTLADYRAALQLHRHQKLGREISWYFWFRIMPVIGGLLLTWVLFTGFAEKRGFGQNPSVTFVPPLVFLLLPLIHLNLERRQFNQSFPPHGRSLSIRIDETGIVCANPGVSESTFNWNAVVGFAQDSKVTMLYIAKTRFLFFPARVMSSDERVELENLIARRGIKREPC
jgi:hypothetical protein